MKAFTLLFVSLFFSFSVFAQETTPKDEKIPNDTIKSETAAPQEENGTEEIDSVAPEDPSTTETKSFTLDANDATVERNVTTDQEVAVETIEPETTVYHYSSHKYHDDIQTLGGKNSHQGGFGGFSFRGTEFNHKDIIMAGFRGGWIINRALAIGFEGHGIIPTAEYENIDPDYAITSRSVGGYGGMFLEPIILSNKVVHITFPISGGAGWLGYIVDWEHNNNYYSNDLIDDDVFWYIEPGAALELNVARNFRINLGASYRFTEDLDLASTSPAAFEAWNYFITFKFGSF